MFWGQLITIDSCGTGVVWQLATGRLLVHPNLYLPISLSHTHTGALSLLLTSSLFPPLQWYRRSIVIPRFPSFPMPAACARRRRLVGFAPPNRYGCWHTISYVCMSMRACISSDTMREVGQEEEGSVWDAVLYATHAQCSVFDGSRLWVRFSRWKTRGSFLNQVVMSSDTIRKILERFWC